MNNFFRFCVFGALSKIPHLTTAKIFILEQILSLLKRHNPSLAGADAWQVSLYAVLQSAKAKPNPELESNYNHYLISDRQVCAFESGLLHQAKKIMHAAESVRRLGERIISAYLDARCRNGSAHNDCLNARFGRQNALID